MTSEQWEQAARDLDALREMVAGEPAIGGGWTCGVATLHVVGRVVTLEAGECKRMTIVPPGKPILVWVALAVGADARICRARAVLAKTFTELVDEEARR